MEKTEMNTKQSWRAKMREFRKGIMLGLMATLIPAAAGLMAVTVTGTINSFGANDVIDSAKINENFTSLRSAVNNIPLGTYCGMTGTIMGALGGYTGAKALCASACNDSRAHMCTSDEMALSLQMGVSVPTTTNLKISNFTAFSTNNSIGDCQGWTSASNGRSSTVYSSTRRPRTEACDSTSPVACCL